MAPLSELSDTIAAMTEIMVKAGRAVAGNDIPVEVSAEVRWPQCLGDVRKSKEGPRDVGRDTGAIRQRRATGHGGIMKKRRAKLCLVGQDPADIFSDLGKLKSDLTSPPERRTRTTEAFARIPHDKALAIFKYSLSSAAWVVMIELDRLFLKRRG